MRRREFISLLSGAVITWPRAATPKGAAEHPLVAVLLAVSSTSAARYVSAFPQGLRELGYVEGENIEILYRYAEGDLTRLPALAGELVQLHPDVIVTAGSAIPEIKRSTATIPIVGVAMTDPVGFGFATSIARPGGQVTGIMYTVDSLLAKQLQLMLEVLPGTPRIGLLLNARNPYASHYRQNAEAAATSFARKLDIVEIREPDDLDVAFQGWSRERVDAVLEFQDSLFLSQRRRIAALAMAARLPTMFAFREHVEDGGLISYGT